MKNEFNKNIFSFMQSLIIENLISQNKDFKVLLKILITSTNLKIIER